MCCTGKGTRPTGGELSSQTYRPYGISIKGVDTGFAIALFSKNRPGYSAGQFYSWLYKSQFNGVKITFSYLRRPEDIP
jgi:hypothetical protein